MTPYQIANSDGIKTQLMETGDFMLHPAIGDDRIDTYVDAARAVANDIGLSPDEIEVRLMQPHGRLWVRVKP